MGEVLLYDSLVEGIHSDVWEVLRCSGEICTDVCVIDVGGIVLYPYGDG